MTRHSFGGGAADWVSQTDATTGDAEAVVTTTILFFDALSAGNPVTDFLDNTGFPVTSVTTDANGYLPPFSGPDTSPDTWKLAADANGGSGPRYWIFSVDAGDSINQIMSQQAANVASIAELSSDRLIVVYYNSVSASYPVRPDTGSPVLWWGPVTPSFGGSFAVDGLDSWIGPTT